ncbi:cytochrome P450 [Pararhizobium capsulatum DSM 1112]|uniref:Cytochrome P450 n=1 Tax=Pararhizobium capsulatum DSM 1112 TaxID=1121113 RepID=A0ABU0BZ96_9HYPH|nr:cytochrome P450 [Pararhizobium capsulatum]MDQ0322162.1 cytochrome P450 [Pararhizobium capsulatum DSM 1112]
MSAITSNDVLRPAAKGLKRRLMAAAMSAIPFVFRLMRRFYPIAGFGSTYIVTRYDDVREVFGEDAAFTIPYKANLDVLTGGEPFILGMTRTPDYFRQLVALRQVMLADDLPELGRSAEAHAEMIVSAGNGRVEVVDQLVRRVTFDVLADYFGVPEPGIGKLDVWATRLFEFQFASSPSDHALRQEVEEIAPAFRDHIDREIARRKSDAASLERPDVIGRCLKLQAEGEPGYSDVEIRTAMLCMIVGGPPQPPMVVPQAMEQLLRRPEALAAAAEAARANEDDRLWKILREALRFDPLAPGLTRIAAKPWTIAEGTRRARTIPKDATVIAAFASAMMDERRIPDPGRFDPDRLNHEYIHFGHGMHECFGRYINRATLHRMVKPLLRQPRLRRASGPEGHLSKNGPFSERLVVEFG